MSTSPSPEEDDSSSAEEEDSVDEEEANGSLSGESCWSMNDAKASDEDDSTTDDDDTIADDEDSTAEDATTEDEDSTADEISAADDIADEEVAAGTSDSCANENGARSATASEIALMNVFIICSAFQLLRRRSGGRLPGTACRSTGVRRGGHRPYRRERLRRGGRRGSGSRCRYR